VRFLLRRLFDFKIGRRLVHLAFEVIACLLEFSQALTESSGEFGKLLRAKEQHHDHKNKDDLRPSWHTEGDWKVHLEEGTTVLRPCKGISQIDRVPNRQKVQFHARPRESRVGFSVINLDRRKGVIMDPDYLLAI
jgi:hypothetical protein